MGELPRRKANRLAGYDYSQPGCYFVTICTKDRKHLFWDRFDEGVGAAFGRPPLSQKGLMVEQEIRTLSATYSMVTVPKYVVMPNHVHLLIQVGSKEDGRPKAAPTLGSMINQFKGAVTKHVGYPIWQKGYHDHIIRTDADYLRVWDYMDTNPAKWREDCYYTGTEA